MFLHTIFSPGLLAKKNRDEFCIISVDTFLVERGEKIFSSCDKMEIVYIDQKVS